MFFIFPVVQAVHVEPLHGHLSMLPLYRYSVHFLRRLFFFSERSVDVLYVITVQLQEMWCLLYSCCLWLAVHEI